jgi:hypothetical protein
MTDSLISDDGRYVSQRGKTVSHFHTDPKLFVQENVKSLLDVGMFVYMDVDGLFKPAIATSRRKANVQGVVYEIIGNNKVYIKHNHGHIYFREPLPPSWYAEVDGKVDEKAPLFIKVPALLGNPLYLSDTIPGGMRNSPPLQYVVQVGYRTEYGFYYKPEPFCCADDI